MKANPAAFDAGQLAERMAIGFYTHAAAISVATDPRATLLSPQTLPGHIVPVGYVFRKDGTKHAFHFNLCLQNAVTKPDIASDLAWVWLAGSLIKVGDVLSRNNYFDHAPELELVRHLRNGVAHGNQFNITNISHLKRFPAHNRLAWVRGDKKTEFEITSNHHGQVVLFDYMGPGDVLDLLMSVGLYLIRMGNGDPLRP